MGKMLVVWYSRTGNTDRVGKEIAEALNCETVILQDKTDRTGATGYLRSGREAMTKKLPELEPITQDLSSFSLVIIGTPVWAFTMASPIRSFLTEYGDQLPDVAFFATQGGRGADRAYKDMSEILQKEPLATLSVLEREIKRQSYKERQDTFVTSLQRR